MSDTLNVTIIQSHLHWENAEANRAMFSEKLVSIPEGTDLVILPEMFTTGFTMNATPLAETMEGNTIAWMKQEAIRSKAAIMGSIIIEEEGNYYNRLIFMDEKGEWQSYDKRHTFTLAGEHKTYTRGEAHLLLEYKGWKINPLICYDLRFPVWARNTQNYDLLIYVANWPKRRIVAWDALLKARAIENMAYCIGVNRVGLDGNGHEYVGHSAVYDVLGEQVSTEDFEKEFVEHLVLSKEHIEKNRRHLQFLNDRDAFSLE
ncbi:amidohydrolase [Aureisphaera galaxeae]|uniref:amidohydrolase n=1 Tax=Aureisphaera galaxeae TaxID=1538023 RepID=UPI0023500C1A|nr:amidohydrolase [Aureisphaera galaxeae]MDC8002636.1 amidohydrolase [Aureisphaera galaxeae]